MLSFKIIEAWTLLALEVGGRVGRAGGSPGVQLAWPARALRTRVLASSPSMMCMRAARSSSLSWSRLLHTPGGMTQLGRDTDTVNAARWAPRSRGTNSVAVHGEPGGWANPVTTDDVVGGIRAHPEFNSEGPTCLWSCYAGSNGTGQAVADELGHAVMAPNGPVTIFEPGSGLSPFSPDGWSTLMPGGG